jgi:hypothetical protein
MSGLIPISSGPCEICRNPATYLSGRVGVIRQDCARCGTFQYDSSVGWTHIESPDQMVRLSGWVRDENKAGVDYPTITRDVVQRMAGMSLPRLQDRAARALAVIVRKWPGLYDWSYPNSFAQDLELQGRSYSIDQAEAMVFIRVLIDQHHLRNNQGGMAQLTTDGLLAAEALENSQRDSAQGFVAMWFDESLRDVWQNGFDPAIRAAGFDPFRIDAKDYVGPISDEIIAEIRRSRFVVADYTGQINGVYFEAGFALGLGLTVIPTCHADEAPQYFGLDHAGQPDRAVEHTHPGGGRQRPSPSLTAAPHQPSARAASRRKSGWCFP